MAIRREEKEEEEQDKGPIEEPEEKEEEEEEEQLLVRTTKVVEYLEPFMSIELLCKFPDNSAYDFDYSQSTIWSPLVPRAYSTPEDSDLITPSKKLSHDMGLELRSARSSVKKVGSKLRKKFTTTNFNPNLDFFRKQKKNKNKKKASDLSPTPPRFKSAACNPTIKKGWSRALKVASKQFKRWKMKRDPTGHVMLPTSFRDGDF